MGISMGYTVSLISKLVKMGADHMATSQETDRKPVELGLSNVHEKPFDFPALSTK